MYKYLHNYYTWYIYIHAYRLYIHVPYLYLYMYLCIYNVYIMYVCIKHTYNVHVPAGRWCPSHCIWPMPLSLSLSSLIGCRVRGEPRWPGIDRTPFAAVWLTAAERVPERERGGWGFTKYISVLTKIASVLTPPPLLPSFTSLTHLSLSLLSLPPSHPLQYLKLDSVLLCITLFCSLKDGLSVVNPQSHVLRLASQPV